MQLPSFPQLSDEQMQQALALPSGKLRVVIDTDAKNEVDDQFALTWALLSQDQLEIEGMYAAPYTRAYHREPLHKAYAQLLAQQSGPVTDHEDVSWGGSYHDWAGRLLREGRDPASLHFVDPAEGMALSYDEIHKIYALLGEDGRNKIFRGAPTFLRSLDEPVRSPAVDHLIERALAADDRPLYVVALAALTNVISAILLEPSIIRNIVVVWTSAYPTYVKHSNRPSMNLIQDLLASRCLFACGVPHVYLPGYHIGVQLTLSLPESETWVRGQGAIGDFLHELYVTNPLYAQRGIREHLGRTWIAWDLVNIAWLLNPAWVPSELVRAPQLDEQMYWRHSPGRPWQREAVGIQRDPIFRDFFTKLSHRQANNEH